jgi:hypothetical protein
MEECSACPGMLATKSGILEQKEVKDKDGANWVVNGYPVKDSAGKVTSIVMVSRDITKRKRAEAERETMIRELTTALAEVKALTGLLPICSYCKNIRDDKGYWKKVEQYISEHTGAEFTHGICHECADKVTNWRKEKP